MTREELILRKKAGLISSNDYSRQKEIIRRREQEEAEELLDRLWEGRIVW